MASNSLLSDTHLRYIANTGAAMSIIPLLTGLYGIAQPDSLLSALEFPSTTSSTTTPETKRVISGLARMYAIRQFGIGMGGIVLWALGARRAMGWSYLATGVAIAGVDGWVSKAVTGRYVLGHYVGVVMAVVFGVPLAGLV